MKNRTASIFIVLVCLLLSFSDAQAFGGVKGEKLSMMDVLSNGNRFTENKGQLKHYHFDWTQCGNVKYYTQSFGGTAYFAENGIGFGFFRENLNEMEHPSKRSEEEEEERTPLNSVGFFLEFVGKNKNSQLTGAGKQITKFNYYRGTSHIENVANFDALMYENLYENIDLKYYTGEGKLKFDYIAKPGANLKQIELRYNGAKGMSVNRKGDLEIATDWGVLIDEKPYSYQMIDGHKVVVKVKYRKNENGNIGFEVVGNYDSSKTLVIDPPTLTWATLVAAPADGTGYLYDIVLDVNGNVYGTGWYNNNFPKVNPIDVTNAGGESFVFKLAADGKTLLYSTWLGGNGDETGTGVAVNASGEAFVCGYTNNANTFPTAGSPIKSTVNAVDIYAVRLSATGALVYSTFYGGTADDQAFAIDIDAGNNAFITGATKSASGMASIGAHQTALAGAMDAFILKINPAGSAVVFCTYYGGSADDLGRDIVVDLSGNAYIGGATGSSIGIATAGSYDNTFAGGPDDGFVAKFTTSGARVYGAYSGGDNEDKVESVDVKCNGELVMSGYTRSSGVTFVAINAIQAQNGAINGGPRDAFMRRVSPDGSALLNSTFMGNNGEDANKNLAFSIPEQQRSTSISVNRLGNIAVALCTDATALPLVSPVQSTNAGGGGGQGDAYIFVTDSTGAKIVFSTYYGGTQHDYPTAGINYHPANDHVFALGGCSHSVADRSLPLTAGSYQSSGSGLDDHPYIVLYSQILCKIDVQLPLPAPGCENDSIKFTADTLCGGATPTFQWLVNDVGQVGATARKFASTKLKDNDKVCVVFSKFIPGCFPVFERDTACVTVSIRIPPIVVLKGDSFCLGATVTIDAGVSPATYLWSSGETTKTISKSVAGEYWVEVTQNNCKMRDTMNLVERAPLALLSDSARTCNLAGTAYTVTFTITGGDPASYKVIGLPGTLVGSKFTSNLLAPGTPFVAVISDRNNCNVVIYSGNKTCGCAPVATISGDKSICKGDSASIVFHLSGAQAPYDVAYSDGSSNFTLLAINDGYFMRVAPSDTMVYSLISITEKNGCSAPALGTVTISPIPVFTLPTTPVDATCFGKCNASVTVAPQSGIGPYSYLWSPNPGAGQGSSVASQLCASAYKVVVSDKYACKDSVTATVKEPQKIVYQVDSIAAHCKQSDGSASIAILSGGTAPFSYSWDIKAASQITSTASNLKSGRYRVEVRDSRNCTVVDSVQVLDISGPLVAAKSTAPSCASMCDGSAALTNISGGTRPFVYQWKTPAGVAPVLLDSAAISMCAGKYALLLSDKFGCKDSAVFDLLEPNPVVAAISSPKKRTCVNGSLQLQVAASGGTPAYTFTWSPANSLSSASLPNPIATPNAITTYSVFVSDAHSCISTPVSIVLMPVPIVDFTFDSVPTCDFSSVQFTNNSSAATLTHTCAWDFGAMGTSTNCDPQQNFVSGSYAVQLTIRDDSGCTATRTKNIDIASFTKPAAIFTANPQEGTTLAPLIVFSNQSKGAIKYAWTFGDGDSSNSAHPNHVYAAAGKYQVCLRAINALSCYADTCENVEIKNVPTIYVPNAFSPNEDNVNDVFLPYTTGMDPADYKLLIFDRWGELIFTSNDMNKGWDGNYMGRSAQIDVYVWKLETSEMESKKHVKKMGRVSLVR